MDTVHTSRPLPVFSHLVQSFSACPLITTHTHSLVYGPHTPRAMYVGLVYKAQCVAPGQDRTVRATQLSMFAANPIITPQL